MTVALTGPFSVVFAIASFGGSTCSVARVVERCSSCRTRRSATQRASSALHRRSLRSRSRKNRSSGSTIEPDASNTTRSMPVARSWSFSSCWRVAARASRARRGTSADRVSTSRVVAGLGVLERDEPGRRHLGLARIGDQRGDDVVLAVRVAQHLEVAVVEEVGDQEQHRAARQHLAAELERGGDAGRAARLPSLRRVLQLLEPAGARTRQHRERFARGPSATPWPRASTSRTTRSACLPPLRGGM